MGVFVTPGFFGQADIMRSEFEGAVGPERAMSNRRLCWDYWYVPGQFAYIRTFARTFFSPAVYRAFGGALSNWGYANLGCAAWTEAWLSYYIDGCRQEFHSDLLHGPWAWVFSLTRWEDRRFSGGETVLLEPRTLDYWHHFDGARPSEAENLLRRLEPAFNQLSVFDARIPHAVAAVEGTRDPIDSRVVLHGWFTPPTVRVDGALTLADVEAVSTRLRGEWAEESREWGRLNGIVTVRLEVDAEGQGVRAETIVSTLVSLDGDQDAVARGVARAGSLAERATFRRAGGASTLVLPFTAADR